jgi:proteasome assembly chaperone (PAC2) family protein
MSAIRRFEEMPEDLRSPTLFAAFAGWNDAGGAAVSAVEVLGEKVGAWVVGEIDPEDFVDFQVNRPKVYWVDDERHIEWPTTTIEVARVEGPRDAVIVDGHEPNYRWRTFAETILEVARELHVARVVTIGALQVDVPHTRPVPLTGSASDPGVAAAHGLRRSSYQGPTGIVGVLHQAALAAGFETVSLWAGVPHYLAGTSYDKATLALVQRAAGLLGADLDLADLEESSATQLADVAELVAEDPELAEYVAELEARDDDDEGLEGTAVTTDQLPRPPMSGEELAAELERYLRDRDG